MQSRIFSVCGLCRDEEVRFIGWSGGHLQKHLFSSGILVGLGLRGLGRMAWNLSIRCSHRYGNRHVLKDDYIQGFGTGLYRVHGWVSTSSKGCLSLGCGKKRVPKKSLFNLALGCERCNEFGVKHSKLRS